MIIFYINQGNNFRPYSFVNQERGYLGVPMINYLGLSRPVQIIVFSVNTLPGQGSTLCGQLKLSDLCRILVGTGSGDTHDPGRHSLNSWIKQRWAARSGLGC